MFGSCSSGTYDFAISVAVIMGRMIPPTPSYWSSTRRFDRILVALGAAGALSLFSFVGGCGGGDADSSTEETSSAEVKESDLETAMDAAHQYFMTGDLEKARAILARLIDSAPGDPRPHELMGQVAIAEARAALELGDADGADRWRQSAADHYVEALRGTPDQAGLQHSAGMVFYEAGRIDAALDAFRTATDLDPLNPQFPLFAAQLLVQSEDYDEAESMLDRVLTLDPDLAIAHASKAIVASNRADYAAALEHIAEARTIEPRRLDFRVQEARIHRLNGAPVRAAELLSPLSVGDRIQMICAEELALAYEALDEHALAEQAWITAYHAAPRATSSWLAAEGIARNRLHRQDRADALFWIGQARLLAPEEFGARIDALEEQIRSAGDGTDHSAQ